MDHKINITNSSSPKKKKGKKVLYYMKYNMKLKKYEEDINKTY